MYSIALKHHTVDEVKTIEVQYMGYFVSSYKYLRVSSILAVNNIYKNAPIDFDW